MLLLEVRRLSAASIDLNDAIEALALLRMVNEEYAAHKIPPLPWMKERMEELEREVKVKKRDFLNASLATARLKREQLRTREERVSATDQEIAALEQALKEE